MPSPNRLTPVSPDNAVLLLVDQQEGLFSRIHQPERTRALVNTRVLVLEAMADAHPRASDIYATLPAGLVVMNDAGE
jgi:hypothetical protein